MPALPGGSCAVFTKFFHICRLELAVAGILCRPVDHGYGFEVWGQHADQLQGRMAYANLRIGASCFADGVEVLADGARRRARAPRRRNNLMPIVTRPTRP